MWRNMAVILVIIIGCEVLLCWGILIYTQRPVVMDAEWPVRDRKAMAVIQANCGINDHDLLWSTVMHKIAVCLEAKDQRIRELSHKDHQDGSK